MKRNLELSSSFTPSTTTYTYKRPRNGDNVTAPTSIKSSISIPNNHTENHHKPLKLNDSSQYLEKIIPSTPFKYDCINVSFLQENQLDDDDEFDYDNVNSLIDENIPILPSQEYQYQHQQQQQQQPLQFQPKLNENIDDFLFDMESGTNSSDVLNLTEFKRNILNDLIMIDRLILMN